MKITDAPLRPVVGSEVRSGTGRWDQLLCGHWVQAWYGDHPVRRRCVPCEEEYRVGQLALWEDG